jgi:hydrogenase expression/formation protein HypE
MDNKITLAHGSGGKATNELISTLFKKYFSNEYLNSGDDSAVFNLSEGNYAFTTDSYVVSPVFFNGGDIGKLAICGTVNDLATSGAVPLYISCGFIIEEGFEITELEKIVRSMAETAAEAGVKIVTGDTKVVGKGAADKIFINTSGIGVLPKGISISGRNAQTGDSIIVTGTIGDHGTSILLLRENLNIQAEINSDCAPLNGMITDLLVEVSQVHAIRDATRGGVAATLNEISVQSQVRMLIYEELLPVKDAVRGVCDILGMDPLFMANEGKMLIFVDETKANEVINSLRKHPFGKDATVIGKVLDNDFSRVEIETSAGTRRRLGMPEGIQIPRIC